ncbi:hypothetical protein [Namhaeicola litoreus]|uniref:Uncharacterized protein n=1 Tax=Namhaeicola litoreus TaxID=1052145 RepID=A0ABW3Y3J6_9FLAO
MIIERNILELLLSNDNETFIDVSVLEEDYSKIKEAVAYLKSNHLIVEEERKPRNLEAFGISNNRILSINVKITDKGRDYVRSMLNQQNAKSPRSGRKNFWRFAF